MAKLEPLIMDILSDGPKVEDELVDRVYQLSNVEPEKIRFRIEKLRLSGKLSRSTENVISIVEAAGESSEADEVFEHGPIRVERRGKNITIQSNWKPGDQERYVSDLKKAYPATEHDFKNHIEEISRFFRTEADPLDSLAYLTIINLFGSAETYSESSFKGKQIIVETAQNIILQKPFSEYANAIGLKDRIRESKHLFDELLDKMQRFLMCLTATKDGLTSVEQQMYGLALLRFLYVRGDAYSQHYEEIARELFARMPEALQSRGFSIDEYFSTVKEIAEQIQHNIPEPMRLAKEEHERFKREIAQSMQEGATISEAFEKYEQSSVDRRSEVAQQYSKLGTAAAFKFQINDRINRPLIDLLSLEFGDTKDWSTPLDMSLVNVKPIIKVGNDYYCFNTPHLVRNAIIIIEFMLNSEERKAFGDVRGDYFEDKTLSLLGEILPESNSFKKLFYPISSGKSSDRAELDGLILDDKNAFFIEIKGKKRQTLASRWQDVNATVHNIKEQICTPLVQSQRAKEYVKSTEQPEFKNKDKQTIVTIDKSHTTEYYLINVTADAFSEFTGDFSLLRQWNPELFNDDNVPWSVSIYDLIVIRDLLDNREDFYDYLTQRIALNRTQDLSAVDELDFLGYFFEHGSLQPTQEIAQSETVARINGFAESIDRYYSGERGEIDRIDKPRRKKKY